jgi:hypothetical protein
MDSEVLFVRLESGLLWPVIAVAQTLNDEEVLLGLTRKDTEAVAPGSKGLDVEIPSAEALQSNEFLDVLVQPFGTLETVSFAPFWATNLMLGLLSELGPKLVTLAVMVVDLPA